MSQWDWVYLVEIKIGKFVLCQRQETYRGLTAEPAMRISGIVLLHFIFAELGETGLHALSCNCVARQRLTPVRLNLYGRRVRE